MQGQTARQALGVGAPRVLPSGDTSESRVVEAEPVGQPGALQKRAERGLTVHAEDDGVVLVEPRPTVRERAGPAPELLPFAEEERVDVEVYPAVPVAEYEPNEIAENDGEPIVCQRRWLLHWVHETIGCSGLDIIILAHVRDCFEASPFVLEFCEAI